MPTITFDDPAALANLAGAARFTFANNYTESDMSVADGVSPADPRLGGRAHGHYHLGYEHPGILEQVIQGATIDVTAEPRSLSNHFGDHIIQLTYDPNHDGVPDPFDLTGIDVLSGTLNVGVEFASGDIGVFNNLASDGGSRWSLSGGTNIIRATLEATGSIFTVDNIAFAAAAPQPPTTPAKEDGQHGHCGDEGATDRGAPDSETLMATASPLAEAPEGQLAPDEHDVLTALSEEILGAFGVEPPGTAHPASHDAVIA